MSSFSYPSIRDRITDAAPGARPPVFGRAAVQRVALTMLAVVIYGTIGPVGSGDGAWFRWPAAWSWTLPAAPSDTSDLLTNMVVYVPAGLALHLLFRRRGRSPWLSAVLTLAAAVVLSVMTELVQQCLPARVASRTDVYWNGVGAALGAAGAVPFQNLLRWGHARSFEQVRRRPWRCLAWLVSGCAVLLMTAPFDFTWTGFALDLTRPLDLLDVRRFGMFAVIGLAWMLSAWECGVGLRLASSHALWRGWLLGIVLETLQLGLQSHQSDLIDIATTLMGTALGVAAARAMIKHGLVQPPRIDDPFAADAEEDAWFARRGAPRGVLLGGLVLCVTALVCLDLSVLARGGAGISDRVLWLPFQLHFMKSFSGLVVILLEQAAVAAVLTAACLAVHPERGRAASLLLVVGLVTLGELANLLRPAGVFDTTPLVVGAVAWRMVVYVGDVLRPRPDRCVLPIAANAR